MGNGDLKVCREAAINGIYGMCVTNITNKTKFVTDTGLNEITYNVQFNFDPNSMTLQNSKKIGLFLAKTGKKSSHWVELRIINGTFQVRAGVNLDRGGKMNTGWKSISDDVHLIELDWSASTKPGNNDGYLRLYIDDGLKQELINLDNDTYMVKEIWLGYTNNPSKLSVGVVFYIDDFVSGAGGHIGP